MPEPKPSDETSGAAPGDSSAEPKKVLPPDLDKPVPDGAESAPPDAKDKDSDDSTPFDDDKTSAAINDIVAKEADDVLAAQDAAAGKGGVAVPRRHGHLLSRWWHNKWARHVTFLVLFGGLVALAVVPTSRYWALNTAGVRSSATVVVVDETTRLPLKGAHVRLAGHDVQTNDDGEAQVNGLRLGPYTVTITHVGFAPITRAMTVGWGSNPLGTVALKATGVQYTIEVKDYLSELPLTDVQATSDGASAVSDQKGTITLTLPQAATDQTIVSLSRAGYRTEAAALNLNPEAPTKVALVLARKAVYITKQDGRFDVFKRDIDGKNAERLLAGTGSETSNLSLVVSPDGNRAALVSTRDNKRGSDGFLESTLTLIDVENGQTLSIAQAPQIQLIAWHGTRLVFEQVGSDGTASNRYAVFSYNYSDNTRLQLAAANKLNAVVSAHGAIYYAVASDPGDAETLVGLFTIAADGSGKQRVFEQEVETVLRATYATFHLQTAEGSWQALTIASGAASPIAAPSSLANRLYIDNGDRSKSLWVQQGALSGYDVASGKETVLKTQSGIAYPVQWLSADAAIYRLSASGEIADYAISLASGSAHKVADVVASYGQSHAQ